MRVLSVIISLIISLGAVASAPKGYIITGEVSGLEGKMVYLVGFKGGFHNIDSAKVVDGKFKLEGNSITTDRYSLRCRPHFLDIILEPGSVLHIKEFSQLGIEVVNGKEQPLLNKYHYYMASVKKENELENDFIKQEEYKFNYLIQNPKGLAAFMVANDCLLLNYLQTKEILSVVDTASYKGLSDYNRLMEKYGELSFRWMVGKKAPDFVAKDLEGNEHRLSDHFGGYILLDF